MTSGPPPPPPPSPPPGEPGRPWEPSPDRKRNPAVVLLGVLLGLFLGFFGLPLAVIALADSLGDDGGFVAGTAFFLPLLIGIVLLLIPRMRLVAAGLVMGASIGMIVGSAACLGMVGIFIASYNA